MAFKAREWRTVGGTVAFGLMMLGAEMMVPSEQRSQVAAAVVLGLGALGGALAAKAGFDAHAASKTPPETIRAQAAAAGEPPGGHGPGETQ